MISFQALGIRFTLPLLSFIVPMLASRLGMRGSAGALLLALGAHELAHLAAAKLARVHISEIRLMPFGGSARIENPYRLPPGQLIPVAAAGPAANLLLAVLIAAMAHWELFNPIRAALFIQPNIILFLFNLLPALPLDGGRILYALLSGPLGERRALNAGIWMGRLLAFALLLSALAAALIGGKLNLTLILAAIFIVASERDERSALSKSRAFRLGDALSASAEPHPARIYQLDARAPARSALDLMRPRQSSWFVLTRNGAPDGLIDGRSIVEHIIEKDAPDTALGDLPCYTLSLSRPSGASKTP